MKPVTTLDAVLLRHPCCKLNGGVRPCGHRGTPGLQRMNNSQRATVPVDKQQVNRKPHERGVNRPAWGEDQRRGCVDPRAPEQSDASRPPAER
jgi:hypothetical protein